MIKKVRWQIASICCAVLLLLPVLAMTAQASYYTSTNFCVQVSSSDGKIYVRSGPGTGYGIVGEAYNGTVLTILQMQYNPNDGYMWGSTEWNGNFNCWVSLRNTTILSGGRYPTPDFYVRTAGDGGSVNMRTVAGTAYPVIMEIPNGVELHVNGLVYNPTDGLFWGLVYYSGYYGWISLRQTNLKGSYNSTGYTPTPPTPTYGTVLYPRSGEVNLRVGPSYNSALVGTVYSGTPMYYYGENGFGYGSDGVTHEWFHVSLANGISGWVRSDLIW